MKFFEPGDFEGKIPWDLTTGQVREHFCDIANAKLVKEAKVVYASRDYSEITLDLRDERKHSAISSNFKNSFYKALLICIEPIEKCTHPLYKIRQINCFTQLG